MDDLRYDLYEVDALVAEVLLPWRKRGVREPMLADRYTEISSLRHRILAAMMRPESDDERVALGALLNYVDALADAVQEWETEVTSGA